MLESGGFQAKVAVGEAGAEAREESSEDSLLVNRQHGPRPDSCPVDAVVRAGPHSGAGSCPGNDSPSMSSVTVQVVGGSRAV